MTDELEPAAIESLLQGRRVLVVDEVSFSHTLSKMLGARECIVDTTQLGADALALVTENASKAQNYDLIFSAISLPDMNAYDLLVRLKSILSRVPLIVTTEFGYDRSVWFAKAFHAGLHRKGIVFKPARFDHVLRAATAVLAD